MPVTNTMTVEQLVAALLKLPNQKAVVTINIKQSNRVYGRQVQIETTAARDSRNLEYWVTDEYGGCAITVHLPDGAYIAKFPE